MTSDLQFALKQLIHSYALQIDYLHLLVQHNVLAAEGAQEEIRVMEEKTDLAAERLWQLIMEGDNGLLENGRPINPVLIPDLQYL